MSMRAASRNGPSKRSASPERKIVSHSSRRSRPSYGLYQTAMYSGSAPMRHVRPRFEEVLVARVVVVRPARLPAAGDGVEQLEVDARPAADVLDVDQGHAQISSRFTAARATSSTAATSSSLRASKRSVGAETVYAAIATSCSITGAETPDTPSTHSSRSNA